MSKKNNNNNDSAVSQGVEPASGQLPSAVEPRDFGGYAHLKISQLSAPIMNDASAQDAGAATPYAITTTIVHADEAMLPCVVDASKLDYSAMCRALITDGPEVVSGLIGNFAQQDKLAAFVESIIPRGVRSRQQARGSAFTSIEQYNQLASELTTATVEKDERIGAVERQVKTLTALILRAIFGPLGIIADEKPEVLPSLFVSRKVTVDSVVRAAYSQAVRAALIKNDPARVFAGVGQGYLNTDEVKRPLLDFARSLVRAFDTTDFTTSLLMTAFSLVRVRAAQIARGAVGKPLEDKAHAIPVAIYSNPMLDRLVHNWAVIMMAADAVLYSAPILSQYDFGTALETLSNLLADTETFRTIDIRQLKDYATVRHYADDAGRRAGMLVASLTNHDLKLNIYNRFDVEERQKVQFEVAQFLDTRVNEVCHAFKSTAELPVLDMAGRLLERERSEFSQLRAKIAVVGEPELRHLAAAYADSIYLIRKPLTEERDTYDVIYQVTPRDVAFAMPTRSVTGSILTTDPLKVLFLATEGAEQSRAWQRDDTDDVKVFLKGLVDTSVVESMARHPRSTNLFVNFLADNKKSMGSIGGEDFAIQLPSTAAFLGVQRTIATAAFWPAAVRKDLTMRLETMLDIYKALEADYAERRMTKDAYKADVLNTVGPVFEWFVKAADSAALSYRINFVLNQAVAKAPSMEKAAQLSAAFAAAAAKADVGVTVVASILKAFGFVESKVVDRVLEVFHVERLAPKLGCKFVRSDLNAMPIA